MKIWLVSGDKLECTKNAGFASGLINNEMNIIQIDSDVPR